jgi:hypothetical protein
MKELQRSHTSLNEIRSQMHLQTGYEKIFKTHQKFSKADEGVNEDYTTSSRQTDMTYQEI